LGSPIPENHSLRNGLSPARVGRVDTVCGERIAPANVLRIKDARSPVWAACRCAARSPKQTGP
ncbi:MAG: hypothetical protein MJH10_16555, partial [Epibacterium sp.]|nr:hypothetical protein [Epibacterium sp.]